MSLPSMSCLWATGIPRHTFKAARFVQNPIRNATCFDYVTTTVPLVDAICKTFGIGRRDPLD